MRKFNTTGPCFPDEHYMIPAIERLPGIRELVAGGNYFVIHAPRQSGKTTVLQALASEINAKGEMVALYCTLESLQGKSDSEDAMPKLRQLLLRVARSIPSLADKRTHLDAIVTQEQSVGWTVTAVSDTLTDICTIAGKPVVVFFDEADCLVGDALISFLRQLRDGYVNRKMILCPKSIALVGMLDVRDYKAQIRPDGQSLGQVSPFNIIAEDMLIPNFTEADIARLYAQHTEETGQRFAEGVVEDVWRLTRGQPWLVNAIANECVTKIHSFRYGEIITVDDVEAAKETIIRRRDTHVDSLMERLKEPRVRHVVEPVILGSEAGAAMNDDDYRYVLDLGLLKENEFHQLVPGNAMYGEIMLRYLSNDEQTRFYAKYGAPFWLKSDGSLDMPALMAEFQRFWRENSGADRQVYGYKEATPHLVMMGYLQRVVNGGGRIQREMALGSKRLDLCVEFGRFRYAVELKMLRNYTPAQSHAQLAEYLDHLGLEEGWMAVFDEDAAKPWDEKIYSRDVAIDGKTIHVIGL